MKKEIKLNPGITGFVCDYQIKKSEIDGFIYTLCRELGYKLQGIIEPRVGRNYFKIQLSKRDRDLVLLCNQAYPYMATAEPLDELSCDITFIDVLEIKNHIDSHTRFTVCKKDYLDLRITSEIYSDLSKNEQKEIDYFKPQSIGALIFNYYD